RRLHRHARRQTDLLLHDAGPGGRGQADQDRRGPLRRRQARRCAGGLRQVRRAAVRLLHARLRRRHAGRLRQEPEGDPRGDRGGAGGQHLRLRHLPAEARRHRRPRQDRREGGVTMPKKACPEKRRVIGTKVSRLDGPEKSTGRAKYSYDINRPGMLHARMLRCPYAHARLKSLDTAAAEKMPGVAAIYVIPNVVPGRVFTFVGEEMLAIAADTEEHASDAIRAVKAEFEVLPHYVQEEDGRKSKISTVDPKAKDNLFGLTQDSKGDVDAAFAKADAGGEGQSGMAVIAHQCLESQGLVAEWDKDGNLTVWLSTQAVAGMPGQFGGALATPPAKVKCITHYMGGGFG